jgi:hypothetical protein
MKKGIIVLETIAVFMFLFTTYIVVDAHTANDYTQDNKQHMKDVIVDASESQKHLEKYKINK